MDTRIRHKILYYSLLISVMSVFWAELWSRLVLKHNTNPIMTPVRTLVWITVLAVIGLKLPIIKAKAGMSTTVADGPIYEMAVELLRKANLKLNQIQIYITPVKAYNALVNGYRDSYYIIITQPLLEALPSEQLKAILAHEIAHIKNRDGYKGFVDLVMFGLVPLLLLTIAGLLPHDSFPSDFLGILGLISLVVLFLRWLHRSRQREYAADIYAASLVGDKETLIQALTVLNEKSRFKPSFPAYRKPLLTHPDLNSRIANLRQA